MPQLNQKWVLAGGCCLAFFAAAVNSSYLILVGTSVSHLTGDLSKFAVETIGGGKETTITVIGLVLAVMGFVLGAMLSGFVIDTKGLALSRPYGRNISFIGCLILASAIFVDTFSWLAVFLASFACGMQNALATHYRGMVLRTTHVTGLLTDFGAFVGMKLRGRFIPMWKCIVPVLLSLFFFLGAGFGAALSLAYRGLSLYLLAAIYLLGGLSWSFIKRMVLGRNQSIGKGQKSS